MKHLFYIVLIALELMAILLSCRTVSTEAPAPDAIATEYTAAVVLPHTEPIPTSTTETSPITYDEIVMLAQAMHEEDQMVYWNGAKYDVRYIARQESVGWCTLNHADTYEEVQP